MTASTEAQTVSNLKFLMNPVSEELYRVHGGGLSLTGELFVDFTADRIWFKVWNEEADTTHWVAQVPERAAFNETLVAVEDTTEALMF
jgi:hypothetical protein